MPKPKLRVSRIRITNTLGVEDLDFTPGAFTVVSGKNGAGKSSVLEGIKAVAGGADATLIRNGADAAEQVLVLEDGTEIRRRTTANGTTLTAKDADGRAIPKPKAFVDGLLDALAFNPVSFLTADRAGRLRMVLEAAPLAVTPDQVRGATAGMLQPQRTDGHALEVLDRLRQQAYDERTGVNRDAKSKRATADQLASGAGADDEVPTDAAALRAQRDRVRQDLGAERERIEAERAGVIDALREETQRKIDEIKAEAAEQASAIHAAADEALTTVEGHAQPALERLAGEIATAEAAERTAIERATNRKVRTQMEAEAEALEVRARGLTDAIAGLDALRDRLLKSLPFRGVEVRDGELYQDDVPFPRLNTAAKVKLALQMAQVRAAGAALPLVCVDGLECLDAETFERFTQNAPRAGLQFVVARVGEGPLQVDAVPEEVG